MASGRYNQDMNQTQEFTIRRFLPEDARSLAEIQVVSYQTAYKGLLPDDYLAAFSLDEQERDWRSWQADHPQDVLLVAVGSPPAVIGYALVRPLGGWPGYDSELLALHIRQGWRGHGTGLALLRAAAGSLQALGCDSLMVWVLSGNHSARRFYERLSGEWLGERIISLSDEPDGFSALESAYGWPKILDLLSETS